MLEVECNSTGRASHWNMWGSMLPCFKSREEGMESAFLRDVSGRWHETRDLNVHQ